MLPLVTISIPLFKCEDFLERCLKSVLVQTYKNIEVILVNDQTPDNSVSIAEKFIAENNLLDTWSVIHLENNSGLSVVRNKGIDLAKGKYIFFLDSDDEITENCIEDMINLAERENLEMVVGEVVAVNEKAEKTDVFPITYQGDFIRGNDEIFKAFVEGKYPVSSWNKPVSD